MDKNTHGINEYVRTFIITFIVVILTVAGIMAVKWFTMPQTLKNPKIAKSADELDYYLIDFLIEKNTYLLMKYPKNYGYNIRLGTLYSIKKDYVSAEREFKIAVEKSPYTAYRARYKLATLYIKLNKLAEAQKIMDGITDKADKNLIKNKGEIYKQIGNKLFEQHYYALAVTKYEKAIFYFKRCDKKQWSETKILLSNAYEKVADMYVEKNQIEEAIDALEKADKLSEAPEINYKLALLYIDNEPSLAAKYLEAVLKEEPEMLNYYMYYDLLMKISESEYELGNKAAGDLYKFKAESFNKYVRDYILYKDDILMEILDIKTSYDKKKKNFYIIFKVQLRNNSPFNIRNLNTLIVFKENHHKIHKYEKPIFAYENIFPMGQQTSVIKIETELNTQNLNKNFDTLEIEIYLFKNPKHKRLIKVLPVKKPMELVKT